MSVGSANGFVPYCGQPPSPSSVHWNYAPILTTILIVVPFLVCFMARNSERRGTGLFMVGWAILATCFLSPLCNIGVALFSARATQHVILVLGAAPLLATFWRAPSSRNNTARMALSAGVFAAAVWLWHSPRLYDATLQNNFVYWAMNLSMIGSAVWFWCCIFAVGGLARLVGVSFVGLEMCLLGALIAFAKTPFYSVHANTTWIWGISQLEDQRLGGLILWVPAGLLGVSYSAAALWLWLLKMERHAPESGNAFIARAAGGD